MHELEIAYRDSESERLGRLHKGTYIEKINNNVVLRLEIGGGSYRWLSNNVVVSLKYADPDFTQPEPLEVVKAYLTKFPSAIPTTFKLNSAHEVEWIKDEMDRRLWLCDKWALRIQPNDPKGFAMLKEIVDHLKVFLLYREKYFGTKSGELQMQLVSLYEYRDEAAIRNKLAEYKAWWSAHKTDTITLT